MVVTADGRASAVALQVLQHGGNAADAAIAAQGVLNVVEPQSSGIGGGGFFLYYEAKSKRIYTFDGREKAPAKAFGEMFIDEFGDPYPLYPDRITGGLPVGVPGTLKLLDEVYGRFASGRFSFSELLVPAVDMAQRGIQVTTRLSRHIEEEKERLKLFEDSRRIFLDEEGGSLKPGVILRQPELAETFRAIQQNGIIDFYEGHIAADIVKAVRQAPFHPGLMEKEDLFYYQVIERDPVYGSYRGYDVFSMGPPSSGGPALIEMLNLLEPFDLNALGRSVDGIHLISEAQKLAFQDRNQTMGDPSFSKVPLDKILSKKFAGQRSKVIRFEYAQPTTQTAVRPLHLEGTHTSHISIVDEQGNMVSFTTTIESVFGSAMIVPGRGFFLNNELTDFDVLPKNIKDEKVPNAAEAEKRPRSSMTPAFLFRDGRPAMIVGSPGGSRIIGTVLNIILNYIDFEMVPADAVRAERVINRDGPLELEGELYQQKDLVRGLEKKGHPVTFREETGNAQVIFFDPANGVITGESDPRGEGIAAGY